MNQRLFFLIMAIVQVVFAVQGIFRPQAVRAGNVKRRTIYANLPLPVYRAVGVVCTGAAVFFFYLFLKPPLH
jgi:uncharacterized membrane protein YidH (DUF202 family)